MRVWLLVCVTGLMGFYGLAQHQALASRLDSLQGSREKAAFLERLYELDEYAKQQRDSLQGMQHEDQVQQQVRKVRVDRSDSLNYILVDAYIKRYGYTSDSAWSYEANQALFRIINRSLETRFRLKHFPVLEKAYNQGRIDRMSMVHYLCKTIQDNKKKIDEGCISRDLEKLFKKVHKMYERYFWWE